jgi:hypothetical protein
MRARWGSEVALKHCADAVRTRASRRCFAGGRALGAFRHAASRACSAPAIGKADRTSRWDISGAPRSPSSVPDSAASVANRRAARDRDSARFTRSRARDRAATSTAQRDDRRRPAGDAARFRPSGAQPAPGTAAPTCSAPPPAPLRSSSRAGASTGARTCFRSVCLHELLTGHVVPQGDRSRGCWP